MPYGHSIPEKPGNVQQTAVDNCSYSYLCYVMAVSGKDHKSGGDRTAKRVFVLGATGTIGRATVAELVRRGHEVVCFVRSAAASTISELSGAELRRGSVTEEQSLRSDGFRGEKFDVILSCLASRTGEPADAWAIDHDAHRTAMSLAIEAGIPQFILLSAICVQKPFLEFQKAKLAFENSLAESGLTYSIVRPTAFFKSLSGQVQRVVRGKSFLIFGDGSLTACKPISDGDLASYLADCIHDTGRHNRILPIGGPGKAITPREQGAMLFGLLEREPRYTQIPIWILDIFIGALSVAGRFIPLVRGKLEYARIGRYYATESMLVFNRKTDRYDPHLTPSSGTQILSDHYRQLIANAKDPV